MANGAAPPNPAGVIPGLDTVAPSSATAFESKSRTAAPTGVIIAVPKGASEMALVLNVTDDTASNTVHADIWGVDRAGNTTWLILAGAAKSKGTTTVLRVSPNITAATNTIAQDVLPSEVLILPVHSDSAAIVYSVGVHFAA